MPHVAVTALGADRPGIVAAVTGVLMRHGGNLEDTAMTNLGGHFAMMLMVDVPDAEDAPSLEAALVQEVAGLGLTVAVRPVDDLPQTRSGAGSAWALSLYGADRPGIVHRVTRLLAEHDANIVDLSTRMVSDPDEQAYVLLLELELPPSADVERLRYELAALAADLGVEAHLRSDEPDLL